MSYVQDINAALRARIRSTPQLVVYGQNIAAGSCLSGLTRGLEAGPGGLVLNTPNVENALIGAGFGLMLKGYNAIYFMKQQDFLLLGMDHLVNTWNVVRQIKPVASFTVVTIVVDSGFEGPQSSLNNFSDFCSLAHISGWAVTNRRDAAQAIDCHLISPGFRVIGVSQRLFNKEMPDTPDEISASADGDVLRYATGDKATIVAFNFAFPEALALHGSLAAEGISASLFSLPAILPSGWGDIPADVGRTKRLIVVDDSKSENRASDRLMLDVSRSYPDAVLIPVRRTFSLDWLRPNADRLEMPATEVLRHFGR